MAGVAESRSGRRLQGIGVGIDPGHNGRNGEDPAYVNRPIWNGHNAEACDTTGTATDGGYPESLFNWNVATKLRTRLEAQGARVVMTRRSNRGVGPCVTTRALILDRGRLDVAVDIHADGGPASGRGFTVLIPVKDDENEKVVGASVRLGRKLRSALVNETPMPISDYYGKDGFVPRNDLAGLNLTTVPKVLIECGNMRNAKDASLLVSPRFQALVAKALEVGIVNFLVGEHVVR
jgi:N-acetylmuramoyl-L-alanine amidase